MVTTKTLVEGKRGREGGHRHPTTAIYRASTALTTNDLAKAANELWCHPEASSRPQPTSKVSKNGQRLTKDAAFTSNDKFC